MKKKLSILAGIVAMAATALFLSYTPATTEAQDAVAMPNYIAPTPVAFGAGGNTLTSSNTVYVLGTAAATVTLPTAVGATGKTFTIKAIAPCTSGTIATTSSQKIDGATTYSLSASNKFVSVISDGTNYWITASN